MTTLTLLLLIVLSQTPLTEPPSAGMAGAGPTVAADAVIPPSGRVSALISGTASHVGTQFGRRYLALPEHRWGRPGIHVRICGDGGCVTRTSTDAGPDLAMQRAGRVADLNAWDFATVCGCPASRGLTHVTIEYLDRAPAVRLPDTSTERSTP